MDYLRKKEVKLVPVIFMVANKIDKDPWGTECQNVRQSATMHSEHQSIPYMEVSALQYKGVKKLFRSITQMVRRNASLWLLVNNPKSSEEAEQKGCVLQ